MKNILFVCNLHFLKKVKGDFSGYEMGILYTHYLRAINILQIIVFSVKHLQMLQLARTGIEKEP